MMKRAQKKAADAAAAAEKKAAEVARRAAEKKEGLTQAASDKKQELVHRATEQKDGLAHAAAEKKDALVKGARRRASLVGNMIKEEALDSSEVEPTVQRRNVLLTVHAGDVDAALSAVGRQYLLTGKLSKATAASVPLVGLAYSTIGPLWDKMRDCCVIAALYGHDIESEAVQGKIYQCVGEMLFDGGSDGGGGMVEKAVVKQVAKKVTARISARSGASVAINSTPLVGAMVNVVIQKTIASELQEVQGAAMVT